MLDIGIGFLLNKVSQDGFNILDPHNIAISIILCLLILAYVVCKIFMKNGTTSVQKKRLQKAFQDNGGYETVVNEMKACVAKHDYKSIRALKKIVDYIER